MQPLSQTVLLMLFQYVLSQTLPYDKSNINFIFCFPQNWMNTYLVSLSKKKMSHTTIFPTTSIKTPVALWYFRTNNMTFIVIPKNNTVCKDDRQKHSHLLWKTARISLTAHFFLMKLKFTSFLLDWDYSNDNSAFTTMNIYQFDMKHQHFNGPQI